MNDGEMQPYTPRRAIRLTRGCFESTPILVAKTDDETWVDWGPIPDLLGWLACQSLYQKRAPILIEHEGELITRDFVRKSDFLGTVLINQRFPDFRRYVVGLLDQLEERGLVVSPTDAKDPLVAMWAAGLESALKLAQLERETRAIVRRQDELEYDQATLAEILDHGKHFKSLVVWLGEHGVRIPENMRSTVGMEFKKIVKMGGYDPSSRPKQHQGKFYVHEYPLAVLEKFGPVWIGKNRGNPEREKWFRR